MSPLCLAGPALCRSAAVSLYTAPHPATVQSIPVQKSASTDALCLPCSIGVGRTCEPSSSVISRAMAWSGQLVTTIHSDTLATVYPQKIVEYRVQGVGCRVWREWRFPSRPAAASPAAQSFTTGKNSIVFDLDSLTIGHRRLRAGPAGRGGAGTPAAMREFVFSINSARTRRQVLLQWLGFIV